MSKNSSKNNTPLKNKKVIEEEKVPLNKASEVYEELADHQSSIDAAADFLNKVSICISSDIISLL